MSTQGWKHRALGAIVGSAVGDALGAPFELGGPGEYARRFPNPVLGGTGEMVGGGAHGRPPGEFTDATAMAIAQAESLLARGVVDRADLFERLEVRGSGSGALVRATATAVHLSAVADPETAWEAARELAAVTHVDPAAGYGCAIYGEFLRRALAGEDPITALPEALAKLPLDHSKLAGTLEASSPPGPGRGNGAVWGCLAQAVWAVRTTASFSGALRAAIDLGGETAAVAAVTGGLAGARYGIQAIPSRWATYVHGTLATPEGPLTYRNADLQDLAHRLTGAERPGWSEPGWSELYPPLGPSEIAPGVQAASLAAAVDAERVPADRAVLSLCPVGDRFVGHPVRREVYLVDDGLEHNPGLFDAVRDAVEAIDALLAEGREIVVHCHAGASRTGLVLRAWLMRRHGWAHERATAHVGALWPALSLWNEAFTAFLEEEWPQAIRA